MWSPLLDRYVLPLLGRRRGWILLTQIGLLAVIATMGAFSPQSDLRTIAWIATILATDLVILRVTYSSVRRGDS